MLTSLPPFYSEDIQLMYQKILREKLDLEKKFKDQPDAISLLSTAPPPPSTQTSSLFPSSRLTIKSPRISQVVFWNVTPRRGWQTPQRSRDIRTSRRSIGLACCERRLRLPTSPQLVGKKISPWWTPYLPMSLRNIPPRTRMPSQNPLRRISKTLPSLLLTPSITAPGSKAASHAPDTRVIIKAISPYSRCAGHLNCCSRKLMDCSTAEEYFLCMSGQPCGGV